MFAWVKKNAVALSVATLMFAIMAAVMAEFLVNGDVLEDVWGATLSSQGMLWTWRIGGLVTWPVFMWLLLRPHAVESSAEGRQMLVRTLVIAALYGGGGLWAISECWRAFAALDEHVMSVVAPFMALASLGLPYLYTWGFVAIYGLARDGLAGRTEHGWMARSLGATVLGIYAIGALIYAAFAVIALPVAMMMGMLPDDAGIHLAADLFGIALSTGNFMSQWYAFYQVDQWFDEEASVQVALTPSAPPEVAAQPGFVPAGPAAPQGTVVLPDGRLVTPDGRVYVPQGYAAPQPGPAPSAPAAPAQDTGAPSATPTTPAPPTPLAPPSDGSDPYGYGSKGW